MERRSTIRLITKLLIFALVAGFGAIQFIPSALERDSAVPESDLLRTHEPPKDIQAILKTSCYDCHSNNTNFPWYSRIQPAAWFIAGHIAEGREELNFSTFGEYSKRRQKSKLRSVIDQIKDDEMPIFSYTLLHWDARLSEEDKKLLTEWFGKLRDSM